MEVNLPYSGYDDYDEYDRQYEAADRYFRENADVLIPDRLRSELRAEVLAANNNAVRETGRLMQHAKSALAGSRYSEAFFQAYRAVEGFQFTVLRAPMQEILANALGDNAGLLGDLPISKIFTPSFLWALTSHIASMVGASDDVHKGFSQFTQRYAGIRNAVFHGFSEATEAETRSCVEDAEQYLRFATTEIEQARKRR